MTDASSGWASVARAMTASRRVRVGLCKAAKAAGVVERRFGCEGDFDVLVAPELVILNPLY